MRRFGVLLLFFFVSVPCLRAQETDTIAAAQVFSVKEFPVVKPTDGIFLPEARAVPLQVADVIRKFTGIQVKDYGGVGGLKTVNVRSLGSEHVGIFIDGIQVDNAQNMQVDLGRFSPDGLSSVSLHLGQKTKRLQTAKEYATGAAIHMNSLKPYHPDGNGGRFRLRGGAFGTVNPALNWEQAMGNITLRTAAEFIYSTGRYRYQYFDTTLVRENSDIRSLRLEMQLSGRVRKGDWKIRFYTYGSERGFPGPVIRRSSEFPFSAERQADQDGFIQGGWDQEWTDRYSTSLKFKHADNYTHYNTHPEKNPMAMPYDLHYRQWSEYVSLAQSYVISAPWSVDLSTDGQWNALNSDVGQFVTPRRASFIGTLATRYVKEKFRIAAHCVYMGAWDFYYTPDAGGWSRENTYRDAWMPSVSIYYSPIRAIEIDGFVKRSYRLPSFNDLYYSQMGNSNLVPELALQTGLDFRFNGNGWLREVRVSPYYNRVSNKIVAIPTSSQFRWTMLNIGKVDITGLDTKADAAWHLREWGLGLIARYTFQRALDHSDPESRTYGNQIPYIPYHSGGLDFSVEKGAWSFAWNSTFTGGRWSRTANIPDYYIRPWTISDLTLGRSFTLRPVAGRSEIPKLQITLHCNNIFNQSYQIVQGYPMPGFNAQFVLSLSW